jgi:3-phenylpropionate/trans-cinnamate dioxygenase ferredoxin subunit
VPNWFAACRVDDVDEEDVIPVEHEGCAYAVYRSPDGEFFATDGHCTHERALLADGLVMGTIIECPKHNGRFDYRTGEGKGPPVTVRLATYPVKVEDGIVSIDRG